MPETLEQSIIDATLCVAETAAFLTVWPWSDEDGDLPGPEIAATMTFHGPITGQLTLRVSSTMLPTLIQNMLGELEGSESPDSKARDALCEVLNMICGNLLTSWQGEEAIFNLNPPEMVGPETVLPTPQTTVTFCLEGTRAEVEVASDSITEASQTTLAIETAGGKG
jgi:CheY-specific phosphatase CheX